MPAKIYLTGFMGCGKSTLGPKLAKLAGYTFHDLDNLIEKETGVSIPEIFESKGENAFRKIEKEMLEQTFTFPSSIISTGGGTPAYFDNIRQINQHGLSIFLHLPFGLIWQRLQNSRQQRPMLKVIDSQEKPYEFLLNLFHDRLSFYLQSNVVIDPSRFTPEKLYKAIKLE